MLKDIAEVFEQDLKNPVYAAQLLKLSLEEESFDVFLINLRDIVRARGGTMALAKTTGLECEELNNALSPGQSPEFKTVLTILGALDISLDFAPIVNKAA